MFIDAGHPRAEFVLVVGEKTGLGQCSADHSPGRRERIGGLGHDPAGIDDGINNMGGSRQVERARSGTWAVDWKNDSRAQGGFIAVPEVFGPENLDESGDGDVPDPLETPFLPPVATTPQVGHPGRLVGFDNDRTASIGQ